MGFSIAFLVLFLLPVVLGSDSCSQIFSQDFESGTLEPLVTYTQHSGVSWNVVEDQTHEGKYSSFTPNVGAKASSYLESQEFYNDGAAILTFQMRMQTESGTTSVCSDGGFVEINVNKEGFQLLAT